jgi:hypothetical protein
MLKLVVAAAIGVAASAQGASAQQAPAPTAPPSTTPTPPPSSYPVWPTNRTSTDIYGYGLSRFYNNPDATYVRTYRDMVAYGRCATNVSPNFAERVLAGDFTDGDTRRAARRLVGLSRACVPAGTWIAGDLLRPALAEAGYKRLLASGTALPAPKTSRALRVADIGPLGRAAACVAQRSPAGVQQLLATTPGTTEERNAAIRAFEGAPGCGQVGEATFKVLPTLRAYIALSAYESLRQG